MRAALIFALWIGSSYATFHCIYGVNPRDPFPHAPAESAHELIIHPNMPVLANTCGEHGEDKGCCVDMDDPGTPQKRPKYYRCAADKGCIAEQAYCVPSYTDGYADCSCEGEGTC